MSGCNALCEDFISCINTPDELFSGHRLLMFYNIDKRELRFLNKRDNHQVLYNSYLNKLYCFIDDICIEEIQNVIADPLKDYDGNPCYDEKGNPFYHLFTKEEKEDDDEDEEKKENDDDEDEDEEKNEKEDF